MVLLAMLSDVIPSACLSLLLSLSPVRFRQVPPDLRSYGELLKALGVPNKFSPRDFISVLRKLQAKSQGRPLDGHGLDMAVGKQGTIG